LAKTGYCASLKRWFHGVREHLIFTPGGMIAGVVQVAGNRHDVQGLYTLLTTTFRGRLLGDNAYWPSKLMRPKLANHGIVVIAASRSNWKFQYAPPVRRWLRRTRGRVERRIGLFNDQFHAGRTRCRNADNYRARRWMKAAMHNCSRYINARLDMPVVESVQHFHLAA
jgi:hypothetical protein